MYKVVRGLKNKFSKNATVLSMKKWAKDESGFEVFEKFGLTQGGVLLALGYMSLIPYYVIFDMTFGHYHYFKRVI